MSVSYNIYANDGAGGPVDYAAPIGSTSALSFDPPPVGPGEDWTFAVRAEEGGMEERNVDCRARLATDWAGADVTGRPDPPTGLTLRRLPGAGIRARWMPSARAGSPRPAGFRAYVGSPTPDYGTIAATVPYSGSRDYSADLAGLSDGVTYQVGVRAYNGSGEEENEIVASARARATGPSAADSPSATPTSTGA